MNINGLEHIHMTILEIIIDGDEVDNQAVFERVREMMSLLGETIEECDFLKEIKKLLDMNIVITVGSSPDKYRITDQGKETFFGGLE